ncbi:GGDEF domain-containing protein [Henriciella mobilis]|uniref:GGDEF domain-containing protein n=1 Tax=Henriciella mobilis TaxID=2305467 RepID=UPI000E672572|nr:GGDEF domain-containing protein [Henriciella mobilis]RIJ16141.1 GGDEF domain-containing protein [Henriciella mobilis]RIJ22947.1 GGDEF domain-containing protein [Henriciella mobilis]
MRNDPPREKSPERLSFTRTVFVTVVAIIVSWTVTSICLFVLPLDPAYTEQFAGPTLTIATIVPVLVAIPVTIVLQRGRLKLERAMRELADVHAELERRSRIDPLTGILNRDAFLKQVNQLRVEGTNGAMLMIDIDHFKMINDQYGHMAGDEALRGFAGALSQAVQGRELIGRLGGEEFGAFVPCEDMETAHQAAERLRLAVNRMIFTPRPGIVRRVTASIGVAGGTPADTLSELMRRADLSLYEAKAAGRDRVIVHAAA